MTAHEMVAKVRNLPPVSEAALKLVGLLDQPDVNNVSVVEVLKRDNVLTAKLLRACNSPAFALDNSVTSVDQAVLILGHEQIIQMVTTIAFSGAVSIQLPGYATQANDIWRHSLIAASAAQGIVSEGVDVTDASAAFTAGLLHDIGKLIVGQFLTRQSQSNIRRLIAEGVSTVKAEQAVLGADHAEVGACLLYLWHLPEPLVEAVANHHLPVLDPQPRLSAIAHLANCVAHLAGAAPCSGAYAMRGNERVLQVLGVTSDSLERIILNVYDSFERVDQFMAMA